MLLCATLGVWVQCHLGGTDFGFGVLPATSIRISAKTLICIHVHQYFNNLQSHIVPVTDDCYLAASSSRSRRMEGFHNLVESAMVLKSVDELSDEGAAPENTPVPKAKGGANKGPKKRPASSTMDKPDPPAKKPGTAPCDENTSPEPAPKVKAKAAMKRPAGKLSVTRNFYKAHGRYGFKINGSEKCTQLDRTKVSQYICDISVIVHRKSISCSRMNFFFLWNSIYFGIYKLALVWILASHHLQSSPIPVAEDRVRGHRIGKGCGNRCVLSDLVDACLICHCLEWLWYKLCSPIFQHLSTIFHSRMQWSKNFVEPMEIFLLERVWRQLTKNITPVLLFQLPESDHTGWP